MKMSEPVADLTLRPDTSCGAFAFAALGGYPVFKLDVIKTCALLGRQRDGFITDTVANTNDHDHS